MRELYILQKSFPFMIWKMNDKIWVNGHLFALFNYNKKWRICYYDYLLYSFNEFLNEIIAVLIKRKLY